jgi:hypothetical protein
VGRKDERQRTLRADDASRRVHDHEQPGREHGEVVFPPVPTDEIIELHLKLEFEIRDLQTLFGFGDVHGAIWFREGLIAVDEQLDPARHPGKRGRYHFTLAHEAGHWRLTSERCKLCRTKIAMTSESRPLRPFIRCCSSNGLLEHLT